MPQSPTIPDIDEITPEWLTTQLAAAGLENAVVSSIIKERVGTGQGARCYRLDVTYVDDAPSLPHTLISKFPAEDSHQRQAATDYKIYLREINFYRYLAPMVSIPTPRCFAALINGSGPEFILLLEDLTPAEQGDQISGCSVEFARDRLKDLVSLHAPTWNNPAVIDVEWMRNGDVDAYNSFIRQAYNMGYPLFMERCSSGLNAEELAILKRLSETPSFPSEPPELEIYCATHSDYRLDNFLINNGVNPPTTKVIDWQTLIAGNPMRDVAYFLGGCVLPDELRPAEESLVRSYHDALVAAGVTDYPWETCWDDYRRALFLGVMTAVVGTAFVEKTERGDQLFAIMAKRHLQQAIALGSDQLIR